LLPGRLQIQGHLCSLYTWISARLLNLYIIGTPLLFHC